MKQFDPKDVIVSGHQFHIFPFGAFKAANLSGELAQIAIPLLTAITALPSSGEGENPLDRDLSELTPALASAFDSLSGDKVESLLKKLLTQSKNITVDTEDGETVYLNEDMVDLFRDVTFVIDGKSTTFTPVLSEKVLEDTVKERGDKNFVFVSKFSFTVDGTVTVG